MAAISRRLATVATFAGNSINTLIVSLQAVILIPLYLHYIGPRLYGAWLGSGEILIWLQALDLGLPSLMIQKIGLAHAHGENRIVAEWLATGTLVLGLMSLIITAVGISLSFFIPGWMHLTGYEAEQLQYCFAVGTAVSGLILFNNSFIGFSRGIQKTVFMNGVLLVSAIAGFFVSIISIFSGLGLWSVILGLLARAFISLFGSLFFVIYIVKDFVRPHFKISKSIFFEFAKVAPASSLGGISYAIMNQSETALVAIFIRPEVAAVLNLTRKAADVGRSFIDTIGYASYGGFAHLVGSKQRSNIFKVYTEIQSFQISASIAIAAAYMAVNQSLVEVWVGKNQYGGNVLTILMALQIVLNTRSTLNNSLYRATGSIITGSIAQFLECLLRVPLIIGFILWFGLAGVPTASIITSIFSSYMLYKMTIKKFEATEIKINKTNNSIFFARLLIFIFGVLSCLALYEPNWFFVVSVGSLFFLFSFLFLVFIDPNLNDTKIFFVGIRDKLLHRFCIK